MPRHADSPDIPIARTNPADLGAPAGALAIALVVAHASRRHRSRRNGESGRVRAATATVLAAALAGGCAIIAPPKAPPYAGEDTVGAVSSDVFVGEWRLVALNPIDGQEVPERTLAYAADGTFEGAVFPTSEMADVTGGEPIRMSGTWRIDGGRLVSTTDSVEVPTVGDDVASRIVAQAMRRTAPVATGVEVYEAGPRRIVIVTDRGDANALERL